jgi:hypothetical protein
LTDDGEHFSKSLPDGTPYLPDDQTLSRPAGHQRDDVDGQKAWSFLEFSLPRQFIKARRVQLNVLQKPGWKPILIATQHMESSDEGETFLYL